MAHVCRRHAPKRCHFVACQPTGCHALVSAERKSACITCADIVTRRAQRNLTVYDAVARALQPGKSLLTDSAFTGWREQAPPKPRA
jgi:hypothetical protein